MDLMQAFTQKHLKAEAPQVQVGDTIRVHLKVGIGVEKVFPVHSPAIEKIELVRHGKVRRAKLYYLRGRVGKAAKIKEAL